MRDRLVVFQRDMEYVYRIGWLLAEEGEIGLVIGEDSKCLKRPEPTDRDAWENWVAHKVARDSQGADHDFGGFYWESSREAKATLATIKLQFKGGKKPLAEWEKRAIAAGWKPPKT